MTQSISRGIVGYGLICLALWPAFILWLATRPDVRSQTGEMSHVHYFTALLTVEALMTLVWPITGALSVRAWWLGRRTAVARPRRRD